MPGVINYLVNVYSLSPEWRFMAEKVPMQPRSRLSRPVFHVTKSGLKQNTKHSPAPNFSWVRTKPRLYPCSFLLFPQRTVFWIAGQLFAFLGVTQSLQGNRGNGSTRQCEDRLSGPPCLWACSQLRHHAYVSHSSSSAQDSTSRPSNSPCLSPLLYSILSVHVPRFHPSWRHTGPVYLLLLSCKHSLQPHIVPIIISVSGDYK